MREKVCDLVYLDTNRYISLNSLRRFYWAIMIIPFMMVVWGSAAINFFGVNWKSLFPLVSIIVWSLAYWIFVLTIQSKRTPKTFELRFLVNGISGLLMSSLFWMFFTSFNLVADEPIVDFEFSLSVLFFYLIFSVSYIALIIIGVHKGIYKKIREKGKSPRVMALDAFLASIIPIAGLLGMATSKMLRENASVDKQNTAIIIGFVLLVFIPSLAHINFVQFYYCKKYGIDCDEYGNTTSPELEPKIKAKKIKKIPNNIAPKKKIPLILKILIGVVLAPIIAFITVFVVFIIIGIIQDIF